MDYEDGEVPARGARIKKAALGLLAVAVMVAAVLVVMKFISAPAKKSTGIQQIAVLKQPPPPPPKPPEKPPEPTKVKEEVKIDQPKDDPKPADEKPADDKPSSDKPLGVDAEGGAGSDGFGLAGNKGGRDFLTTGGGNGAYYTGLLQRHFFEALSRNRKMLKDEFRVVVKVWLGDDGRVQKADIVSGSGNAQVDDMIQITLLEMNPLKDVPPSSMRPMQLRLSNRS